MANGTVPPGYTPPAVPSKEDKKREFEYQQRSKAAQRRLDEANAKSQKSARGKKRPVYERQSFSNPTDFGAGAAGPGIPYSIKTDKVPAKGWPSGGGPKGHPQGPPKNLNEGSTRIKGDVGGLWATPGKKVDWKLAAIRRRLGNG